MKALALVALALVALALTGPGAPLRTTTSPAGSRAPGREMVPARPAPAQPVPGIQGTREIARAPGIRRLAPLARRHTGYWRY